MKPEWKRIGVIGASGGTGRLVVERVGATGNVARALVRDPAKVSFRNQPNVEVVVGDVLDVDLVAFVSGCDAVISCLGSPIGDVDSVASIGTRRLVEAMQVSGVDRIVFVSSDGAGASRRELPLPLRMGAWFTRRYLADKELAERALRESSLNWTIVRPSRLTDGPESGQTATSREDRVKSEVSREDLATFLLQVVDRPETIGQCFGLFTRD
ncbi:MAG: NAD(P)-binding oxidoreductase [Acidimicrobiia bacterium]